MVVNRCRVVDSIPHILVQAFPPSRCFAGGVEPPFVCFSEESPLANLTLRSQ